MFRNEASKVRTTGKVTLVDVERIFVNDKNMILAATNITDIEQLKASLKTYSERIVEFEREQQ